MTELKTATFACIHFAVAFSVGWMVTGSPVIGGYLAAIEPPLGRCERRNRRIADFLDDRVTRIDQIITARLDRKSVV